MSLTSKIYKDIAPEDAVDLFRKEAGFNGVVAVHVARDNENAAKCLAGTPLERKELRLHPKSDVQLCVNDQLKTGEVKVKALLGVSIEKKNKK